MNAQMQEQMRIQMIESFRQQAALMLLAGIAAKSDPDDRAPDLAKRAKRLADALVTELFPDES